MALAVASATFELGSDAILSSGTSGEAITQGQPIYQKPSDSKWYRAVTTSSESANASAIAATSANSADKKIGIVTSGSIVDTAGPFTDAESYYVDNVVGQYQPASEAATTQYIKQIGIAEGTTKLKINFFPPSPFQKA